MNNKGVEGANESPPPSHEFAEPRQRLLQLMVLGYDKLRELFSIRGEWKKWVKWNKASPITIELFLPAEKPENI